MFNKKVKCCSEMSHFYINSWKVFLTWQFSSYRSRVSTIFFFKLVLINWEAHPFGIEILADISLLTPFYKLTTFQTKMQNCHCEAKPKAVILFPLSCVRWLKASSKSFRVSRLVKGFRYLDLKKLRHKCCMRWFGMSRGWETGKVYRLIMKFYNFPAEKT